MKYVALLSGGKDSCYNLLHCSKNNHVLVAAASLGPEHGKEELDSYLYQTVGQDAIEFVARALEVPLYRRIISGRAVEQGSEYGGRNATDAGGVEGDETEDLHALLSNVKSQHPDIQGVSVGAILSNYQRVRVEHVCRRLSLTPLCYLWQRDQGELLSEMVDAGMEAILIKVSGIGLTTQHLGRTLVEMQPTLTKLNNLYGSHICGEGGEYESLTLDCPLFRHRIVLTDVEIVIHSDKSFATVAFLRIKNATLQRKSEHQPLDIRVPPLLVERISDVSDVVVRSQGVTPSISSFQVLEAGDITPFEPLDQSTSSKMLDSWVSIANIQRRVTGDMKEVSIEDEVRECFHILQDHLSHHSLDLCNATNINIFLSSMDLFTSVNTIYSTFFGTSPPARACVAIDLPPPIRVKLDCIAYSEHSPSDRQALHVQGLSYWAPANIGPYSQAIKVNERIFVSGQIGLVPSSLTLPSPTSLPLESALCFQHVERVIDALRNNSGGRWTGHPQANLYWLVNVDDVFHIRKAHEVYQKANSPLAEPTLFLVVKALPKGALVEKQCLWHTGHSVMTDVDGYESPLPPQTPKFEQRTTKFGDNGALHWEISRFDNITASFAIICVRGGDDHPIADMLQTTDSLRSLWTRCLSIRLFYTSSRTFNLSSLFYGLFSIEQPPVSSIACRLISTREKCDWDYAVCILAC